MVDYYFTYCTELVATPASLPWWHAIFHYEIPETDDIETVKKSLQAILTEDAVKLLESEEQLDSFRPNITISEGVVTLFSEFNCMPPESAAAILLSYCQKFNIEDGIGLEWAYNCSQLRNDGFGGGACHVTKNGVEWLGTKAWLEGRKAPKTTSSTGVRAILDISTCHLPEAEPDWGEMRVAEYDDGMTGFFYVLVMGTPEDEPSYDDMPEWLLPIHEYANKTGCLGILFSPDGDEFEQFKRWEW